MKFFSIKCDLVQCLFCVSGGGRIRYKMPSDVVCFAVTTGLGVSVLAGIVSGVCYILAHGIRRKSNHNKTRNQWSCPICGTYLRSVDEQLLEVAKSVTCSKCGVKVCKSKCSRFIQRCGWTCRNCLRPPEPWFQGILSAIQPNAKGLLFTDMNPEPINEHDEDLESLRKKEKEQVRDFIERLVNVMLGENVDDATVTRLYNDKQYDEIFNRYHQDLSTVLTDLSSALHISMANLPVTGQSPCTAHAALKQLIEKLLKDTSHLTNLQKAQEHLAIPLDDTNRTYEDLLATAIINKVISSCQNNLPPSSANSVSSRLSTSSRQRDDKEYFFGEETLDNKWKTTDLDTTSVSSLEEWIQSEASIGSKKYVDKVTLMIKQDIEEVFLSDSENEQNDADYFRTSSSIYNEDDDDTNWYLQKRQFHGTHSPVPVPMLVPKPTTEAKVLIGDKEIDETSDLSDAASDFEENESLSNSHKLLIESKTIIGGKNSVLVVDKVGEESGASSDSGVKEFDEADSKTFEGSLKETAKTDITVDDDNVEDSSLLSVYSNTEKEVEYTERYASLPRTIIKTPVPASRQSLDQNSRFTKLENNIDVDIHKYQKHIKEENPDVEFVGNYSKREKEKWKHAVEMKNNPYSKENIEKRIQRSNSSTSSLYGSDYYARQASSPSGGKVKSSEVNGVTWPPKPSGDVASQTNGFHQALPAVVTAEDENNSVFEPDNQEPIKPDIKSSPPLIKSAPPSELTSDSDLSYVNFYDVENSQVYRKNKDEYKPFRAVSPAIYGSFKMASDENSNDVFVEKHHIPYVKEEELIHIVTKEAHPVPVAKPRKIEPTNDDNLKAPLFTKAHPPVKQRNIIPHKSVITIRRNRSESDIQVDSFDKPFTVIQKKKDNTLISRIYSSMNVKHFALGQRQNVSEREKPALRSQMSLDSKIVELKLKQENSDDGHVSDHSSKTGRMSFFSSEEDMLSLNSNSSNLKSDVLEEPKIRAKKYSVSSEDGVLSGHYTSIRKVSTSKYIYSSSEDLLSIDETRTIPKRKDNTLISKIYLDPNVRNFALHNRDYIPDTSSVQQQQKMYSQPTNKNTSREENNVSPQHLVVPRPKSEQREYSDLSSAEISLEYIHDDHDGPNNGHVENGHKEDFDNVEWRSETPDPNIDEIAKIRVVHNVLGRFSKSQSCNSVFSRSNSLEDDGPHISVKELKKMFENNDTKNEVVSSLTARSLPKQIKDSLRE